MGYGACNKENDIERKSYTGEFKIRAVQLMGDSFKPIRKLVEELGVSENNLYNWRKQLREKTEKVFFKSTPFGWEEMGDPVGWFFWCGSRALY